jgi:hypothetical protein
MGFIKFVIVSLSFIGVLYFIEMAIISNLSDKNRIRKWWRNHIVGE